MENFNPEQPKNQPEKQRVKDMALQVFGQYFSDFQLEVDFDEDPVYGNKECDSYKEYLFISGKVKDILPSIDVPTWELITFYVWGLIYDKHFEKSPSFVVRKAPNADLILQHGYFRPSPKKPHPDKKENKYIYVKDLKFEITAWEVLEIYGLNYLLEEKLEHDDIKSRFVQYVHFGNRAAIIKKLKKNPNNPGFLISRPMIGPYEKHDYLLKKYAAIHGETRMHYDFPGDFSEELNLFDDLTQKILEIFLDENLPIEDKKDKIKVLPPISTQKTIRYVKGGYMLFKPEETSKITVGGYSGTFNGPEEDDLEEINEILKNFN